MDYSKSGVDVDIEAKASQMLYEASKKTFANRTGRTGEVLSMFDDFSGLRAAKADFPPGTYMCMGFDTVGTKVEIAQRMNFHKTIAFDLLAMVCDDAIVRGAEPVLAGSNLDVTSLGTDNSNLWIIEQLAEGYVEAAKAANVAVINGELCQLGNAVGGYGKFAYNWGASVVWLAKKEKLFTGKEIKEGDSVVVFEEEGFRTNGITLMRKIFESSLGKEWHETKFEGDKLGNHALRPSKIYSKALVAMHGPMGGGSSEIHGVAHITGGGVAHKVARILKPAGLGAKLDSLFSPCHAMKYCQELGNVSDFEAYKTWNMGQGLAVVTPEPDNVMKEAERFGIVSRRAGAITNDGKISIESHGRDGGSLSYPVK